MDGTTLFDIRRPNGTASVFTRPVAPLVALAELTLLNTRQQQFVSMGAFRPVDVDVVVRGEPIVLAMPSSLGIFASTLATAPKIPLSFLSS